MHDERKRRERHQLVEDVHREQILGERDAADYAEGDREKGIEPVPSGFVFHVGECVQRRNRPEHGNDRGEDCGCGIYMQ